MRGAGGTRGFLVIAAATFGDLAGGVAGGRGSGDTMPWDGTTEWGSPGLAHTGVVVTVGAPHEPAWCIILPDILRRPIAPPLE